MRLRSGRIVDDESLLNSHIRDDDAITNSEFNSYQDFRGNDIGNQVIESGDQGSIEINEQCHESPISACGKCITCNKGYLKTDPLYYNKVTGEQFIITDNMDCKTTGIVYLITCAEENCPLQYIGQSVNSVNTRCIQHRSGLRSGNEPKFVRDHFTKIHKPSDLRITPLKMIQVEDTDPATKRKSLCDKLKEEENCLILQLNCLFPYGLNDRLEKPKYMDAEEQFLSGACIYKIFPKIVLQRHGRGSGNQSRNSSPYTEEDLASTLSGLKNYYISDNIRQCRTFFKFNPCLPSDITTATIVYQIH